MNAPQQAAQQPEADPTHVSCVHCGKAFSHPYLLAKHTNRKVPCMVPIAAVPADAPYRCSYCNRPLSEQRHLQRHLTRCKVKAHVESARVQPDPVEVVITLWLSSLGFSGDPASGRITRTELNANMFRHAAVFTEGFQTICAQRPDWQLLHERDCPVFVDGQANRPLAQINTILSLARGVRIAPAGESKRLSRFVEIKTAGAVD